MQAPILVLNQNTKRDTGNEAQKTNIQAAKAVSDIIRTCLGPRSMLKMILDPMGGLVITNDGNAILREVDVAHPAAKSMIELSRAQDEEVGDGTTSVIVLAGELLSVSQPLLERNMHPKIIVGAYYRALDDALAVMDKMSFTIDMKDRSEMVKLIHSTVDTKFSNWISGLGELLCELALDAVMTVTVDDDGRKDIDIKKYARVEKVPGEQLTDSKVIRGVMINKDVTHPKMRRRIENPRILLLDCPLEYKKGESNITVDVSNENDFARLLEIEEEYIEKICMDIIKHKPDVVFTEKGLSDLAQHYFVKHNITALRRFRKTDNNRIARAVGATIVHRTEEITEDDIGKGCGLFEIRKIGDEYFTFLEECKNPTACTILLRGATKDVLNEVERNLNDAMQVARNVVLDPRLLPGGGACEMEIARVLKQNAQSMAGIQQWPYQSLASALEVIPRTLVQNCGANVIRQVTALRAKHATDGNQYFGINGETGEITNMKDLGVWEPYAVKSQTLKTAIEAACMLLRIGDVVSGLSKKKEAGGPQAAPPSVEDGETFGDARDG